MSRKVRRCNFVRRSYPTGLYSTPSDHNGFCSPVDPPSRGVAHSGQALPGRSCRRRCVRLTSSRERRSAPRQPVTGITRWKSGPQWHPPPVAAYGRDLRRFGDSGLASVLWTLGCGCASILVREVSKFGLAGSEILPGHRQFPICAFLIAARVPRRWFGVTPTDKSEKSSSCSNFLLSFRVSCAVSGSAGRGPGRDQ